VGRLVSGMRVNASFQMISAPVGRLGSGPRVGAGGYLRGGIFGRRLSPGGVVFRGLCPVCVCAAI